MAGRTTTKPRLVKPSDPLPRRNKDNLANLAYERLEELVVTCGLRPGQALSIQELQSLVGYGRTPVHQAVNRLAADTIIIIRPRHGLQIAPIDLARERMLLKLRRDLERFVIRLAAERSGPSQRNQILHVIRLLRDQQETLTIAAFNQIDRRIDRMMIAAAAEPFLEHTLRPLHTIFRRVGWIYHNSVAPAQSLLATMAPHLEILEAVAARQVEAAVAAADRLMDFADSMLDRMEREVDPVLLDCSLDLLSPEPR
jgi:DNA-binding GntR family transcriptional regulator